MTAWVGGLAVLVLGATAAEDDLATPAGRFSRIAGWAIVVVLATGTINALLHVDAPDQLWTTTWGRLVLAKLALFAGIAWLGWRNRTRLLPRLTGARKAFRTMALAEVALMIVAFGTATGLASSIPADAEAAARIQSVVT
ncbi:MAG: copper transporter, partial [Micromonosporaceae bacterium]|nr:copper transporter [Micromonosporaceae bacterium]